MSDWDSMMNAMMTRPKPHDRGSFGYNAEYVQKAREAWWELDQDGMGHLDAGNLLKLVGGLWSHFFLNGPKLTSKDRVRLASKLLTRCDAVPEGHLGLDEFIQWYSVTVEIWPSQRIDTPRMREEATDRPNMMKAIRWDDALRAAKDVFDSYDRKGDGVLSSEGLLQVAQWLWDEYYPEGEPLTAQERVKLADDLLDRCEERQGGGLDFYQFSLWHEATKQKVLILRSLIMQQKFLRRAKLAHWRQHPPKVHTTQYFSPEASPGLTRSSPAPARTPSSTTPERSILKLPGGSRSAQEPAPRAGSREGGSADHHVHVHKKMASSAEPQQQLSPSSASSPAGQRVPKLNLSSVFALTPEGLGAPDGGTVHERENSPGRRGLGLAGGRVRFEAGAPTGAGRTFERIVSPVRSPAQQSYSMARVNQSEASPISPNQDVHQQAGASAMPIPARRCSPDGVQPPHSPPLTRSAGTPPPPSSQSAQALSVAEPPHTETRSPTQMNAHPDTDTALRHSSRRSEASPMTGESIHITHAAQGVLISCEDTTNTHTSPQAQAHTQRSSPSMVLRGELTPSTSSGGGGAISIDREVSSNRTPAYQTYSINASTPDNTAQAHPASTYSPHHTTGSGTTNTQAHAAKTPSPPPQMRRSPEQESSLRGVYSYPNTQAHTSPRDQVRTSQEYGYPNTQTHTSPRDQVRTSQEYGYPNTQTHTSPRDQVRTSQEYAAPAHLSAPSHPSTSPLRRRDSIGSSGSRQSSTSSHRLQNNHNKDGWVASVSESGPVGAAGGPHRELTYGVGLCLNRSKPTGPGQRQQHVVVTGIAEGSPADESRMFCVDDRLLSVDGWSVEGRLMSEIAVKLKGPLGSVVELYMHRPGLQSYKAMLVRRNIILPPHDAASCQSQSNTRWRSPPPTHPPSRPPHNNSPPPQAYKPTHPSTHTAAHQGTGGGSPRSDGGLPPRAMRHPVAPQYVYSRPHAPPRQASPQPVISPRQSSCPPSRQSSSSAKVGAPARYSGGGATTQQSPAPLSRQSSGSLSRQSSDGSMVRAPPSRQSSSGSLASQASSGSFASRGGGFIVPQLAPPGQFLRPGYTSSGVVAVYPSFF